MPGSESRGAIGGVCLCTRSRSFWSAAGAAHLTPSSWSRYLFWIVSFFFVRQLPALQLMMPLVQQQPPPNRECGCWERTANIALPKEASLFTIFFPVNDGQTSRQTNSSFRMAGETLYSPSIRSVYNLWKSLSDCLLSIFWLSCAWKWFSVHRRNRGEWRTTWLEIVEFYEARRFPQLQTRSQWDRKNSIKHKLAKCSSIPNTKIYPLLCHSLKVYIKSSEQRGTQVRNHQQSETVDCAIKSASSLGRM